MTGVRETTPDACVICQQQAGEVEVPGGYLLEDERVVAFHAPPSPEGTS